MFLYLYISNKVWTLQNAGPAKKEGVMSSIILASGSPRRKEILKKIGLSFKQIPAEIDEKTEDNPPKEQATIIALEKAKAVLQNNPDSIVIGADTIVVYDNIVLGKPKDKDDAFKMLNLLSGDYHEVYTGLAVVSSEKEVFETVRTIVRFKELTIEEIEEYISTGEPIDKAGAYGIQGLGGLFVESIGGDYYNVVGLPICKLYCILKEHFNINILK